MCVCMCVCRSSRGHYPLSHITYLCHPPPPTSLIGMHDKRILLLLETAKIRSVAHVRAE